jgi:hypothetical protein
MSLRKKVLVIVTIALFVVVSALMLMDLGRSYLYRSTAIAIAEFDLAYLKELSTDAEEGEPDRPAIWEDLVDQIPSYCRRMVLMPRYFFWAYQCMTIDNRVRSQISDVENDWKPKQDDEPLDILPEDAGALAGQLTRIGELGSLFDGFELFAEELLPSDLWQTLKSERQRVAHSNEEPPLDDGANEDNASRGETTDPAGNP